MSEAARRLAVKAIDRGYQLSAEALERLVKTENPLGVLEELLSWLENRRISQVIIDRAVLERFLAERAGLAGEAPEEPPLDVALESPTYEGLAIEGVAEEQRIYLLSRYQSIRRVFEERGLSLRPARELMREGGEAYVVGMILNIRRRDTHFLVEMEDPVDNWSLIAPTRDRALSEKMEYILPDMVVVFRVKSRRGLLVASDVYLPDTPGRRQPWRGPDRNVCIISDIHVGSMRHAAERLKNFLDWLGGPENEAEKTSLLIINGDLVEGVYVFPGQEAELSLKSYGEQFAEAAKALTKIPPRIKIIYVPGNHEPCRRALPQPPIQPRFRQILGDGRILYTGNPAWIKVGGLKILAFHGQTLDDIIQAGTLFSYSTLRDRSGELMELLLKSRHLAPTLGVATPILPTRTDYLAIPEPPDVLCLGHTHVAAYTAYKGTQLVNTGSWQEQTRIQESIGLEPSVGTAALLNLKTLSIRFLTF
ncbi:MAG: metallophosphoesterase [Nitrososphaerota archaeon]|nr:metallophosphoesterase [Candidatus Calditenuaceae archaeon]MDW8074002.1 metallophosphoesterase [Nitrososphaerota archaeon]